MIESFCKGMAFGALIMSCIALMFVSHYLAQTGAILSIAASLAALVHRNHK